MQRPIVCTLQEGAHKVGRALEGGLGSGGGEVLHEGVNDGMADGNGVGGGVGASKSSLVLCVENRYDFLDLASCGLQATLQITLDGTPVMDHLPLPLPSCQPGDTISIALAEVLPSSLPFLKSMNGTPGTTTTATAAAATAAENSEVMLDSSPAVEPYGSPETWLTVIEKLIIVRIFSKHVLTTIP